MPEGPEIETEKLHEAVHEELEREGGSFLRRIALTTAILAVIAALAALQAGSTVNEALMLRSDAARLQAEVSDTWAFYQAKGIKAAVQESARTSWLSIGKEPPPEYGDNARRYAGEQAELQNKAKDKERERDACLAESDHLLHRHHRFASSVVLLQISIALGALAALTRQRWIWAGSLLAGLTGTGLFLLTSFGG
jgi:Domain of unknown function (DUF4337)